MATTLRAGADVGCRNSRGKQNKTPVGIVNNGRQRYPYHPPLSRLTTSCWHNPGFVSLANRYRFPSAFIVPGLTTALFLVVCNTNLPILNRRRSVKDPALVVEFYLRLPDEVATHRAYYQDLPLDVQRYIVQVGWAEPFELWDEEFNRHAADEATFWKKWNGINTISMHSAIAPSSINCVRNPAGDCL